MDKNFDRMTSHFDRQDKKLNELIGKMKVTKQRLAGLQHQAQQPRLTTEGDVKTDKKTRKRTKGAAADRMKHGDTSSARVDHDPMCQTSFSEEEGTEPPALPICRNNALVDEGAEVPNPRLSPEEMRMSISAGGLLLADTASTTMRVIFPPPPLSWSLGEKTKNFSMTCTAVSGTEML